MAQFKLESKSSIVFNFSAILMRALGGCTVPLTIGAAGNDKTKSASGAAKQITGAN